MRKLSGDGATNGVPSGADDGAAVVNTDATRHIRMGWLVVLAGVGSALLWAATAPLDQGVPVSGTVTVVSNRKAVQHKSGGTVAEILVAEGDKVTAGQPLLRMNDVQPRAEAELVRVQYYAALATQARLLAEQEGGRGIRFAEQLLRERNDTQVAQSMRVQQELLASRQQALASELAALAESEAGMTAQAAALRAAREDRRAQLALIDQQLVGMRDLARDGYVAQNRLLDLERARAQLAGAVAEDGGNLARLERQIAESQARGQQRRHEYQKEVRSQLSEVMRDAQALSNRLSGQNYELDNIMVKAPVDGVVMGMNVFTVGGVVAPGFRLMDIVPTDDPLVVEGQLPVTLVDKVHPGLPVELLFPAFNRASTPQIPGTVTQVSADRFVDERTGMPYYKLKAQVAPAGIALIKELAIRPGMPVELFVKTGERTFLSYLMKPITDRARSALAEE